MYTLTTLKREELSEAGEGGKTWGMGKVTNRKKSGDDTERRVKQEEGKSAERKGETAAVKWREKNISDKE